MVRLEQATEYTNRDALWLLVATWVCVTVALLIQIVYCFFAVIDNPIYIFISTIVWLANSLILFVCRRKPLSSVLCFSWIAFVCIVEMLIVDAGTQLDTFPRLADLLAIIAIGTAYVCGLRRTIPYIIANVAVMVWLAFLYGLSDTVPVLAACVILSVSVGRLRDELHRNRKRADMTEEAIKTYVRVKNGG